MIYYRKNFTYIIDLNAVDNGHRANLATEDGFIKAISDVFHVVIAPAARRAPTHSNDGKLPVTYDIPQNR